MKSTSVLNIRDGGSVVKNPLAMQEMWVRSLGQEDSPWRKKGQPSPVFLPGKSHGQRSLVGYSPWGLRVGHDLETKSPPPPPFSLKFPSHLGCHITLSRVPCTIQEVLVGYPF